MLLYGKDGQVFNAIPCKRPKMTNRSGRTWDSMIKSIDDVKREFSFDTSWGKNFYFMYGGIWYKLGLQDENSFDENSFFTKEDKSIDEKKKKADQIDMSLFATINAWNGLAYDEEARNYDVSKMWEEVLLSNERTLGSETKTLSTLQEFKNIVKAPSKTQKEIIAMFKGVYKEKDLISENNMQ